MLCGLRPAPRHARIGGRTRKSNKRYVQTLSLAPNGSFPVIHTSKLFGLLALSEPSTGKKPTRDEVLKRMLKMPPKPHAAKKSPPKPVKRGPKIKGGKASD